MTRSNGGSWADFRKFLIQGNVIDLAVAVIITDCLRQNRYFSGGRYHCFCRLLVILGAEILLRVIYL